MSHGLNHDQFSGIIGGPSFSGDFLDDWDKVCGIIAGVFKFWSAQSAERQGARDCD
jgi:hypothetical protein